MSAEPVSIFSTRIDPAGVLDALARVASHVATDGAADQWRRAEATFAGATEAPLIVVHDRHHYRGPGWRTELLLLREALGAFPPSAHRSDVMRAAASCRFSVALDRGCLVDLDVAGPRRSAVLEIASQLDGLIVSPTAVRDPSGRVLVGVLEPDPGARVPIGATTVPSGELLTVWGSGADEVAEPDAARVARRALAMAAVSSRAFLEQMDPAVTDVELERVKLHAWVDAVQITDELEPEEWRVIQTRAGALDPGRAVDAAWRFEGLTVLAWALGRADVPPDHQLVEATTLFPSIGFLDFEASQRLVDEARLRPIAEIEELADRLAILLEQLRGMRRRKRDQELTRTARSSYAAHFASAGLGSGAWEGPALDADAPVPTTEAEVAQVENIVLERLVAATWLLDGGIYAHVAV